MSQSCFSLGFLSQNSLWKLSTFCEYKGIYSSVYKECKKLCFNQTGHSGDLTPRLERVTSLSHELTAWPNWKFCPVVLQLSWPFISPTCFTRVPPLATCQSLASRKIQLRGSSWVHTSWVFFTLSHTQPLHNSHLKTGYLITKLQENLARNKANTWLNKLNFTTTVYWESRQKCPLNWQILTEMEKEV